MRNKKVSFFLLATIVAATCMIGACDDNNSLLPPDNLKGLNATEVDYVPDCNFLNISSIELSEIEKEMLLFVWEEEKMARDVYEYLDGICNKQIFKKIAASESIHMEKVLCLLIHFKLEDLVIDEPGKFTNTDLQDMYNDLIALGSGTIVDALKAGAKIEDFDIADINEWISMTSNESIIQVFENLVCGSENHLVAFVDQLESFGFDYSPYCISEDEFDAILNTGQKQCGF
jgi:hypothetical protein